MFIGRYKKTYSKQKIAFMINRPLNVSPAKPPANPSPTFHQLHAKWRRKRWGRKNENATGNFPYSSILLCNKENYSIKSNKK